MVAKFIYNVANNYNWKNIFVAIILVIAIFAYLFSFYELFKDITKITTVAIVLKISISMLVIAVSLDHLCGEMEKANKKHQKQIRG